MTYNTRQVTCVRKHRRCETYWTLMIYMEVILWNGLKDCWILLVVK